MRQCKSLVTALSLVVFLPISAEARAPNHNVLANRYGCVNPQVWDIKEKNPDGVFYPAPHATTPYAEFYDEIHNGAWYMDPFLKKFINCTTENGFHIQLETFRTKKRQAKADAFWQKYSGWNNWWILSCNKYEVWQLSGAKNYLKQFTTKNCQLYRQ